MKKILSFIPVILIMTVIFGFSAQNGEQSGGLSEIITQFLAGSILHGRLSQEEMLLLEFIVRKAAHFSEYFLLSLSLIFALHTNGLRGRKLFFVTLIWCFLYACTDEYHQSFVGGRFPQLRDVMIDTCGGLCGDVLAHFIPAFSDH